MTEDDRILCAGRVVTELSDESRKLECLHANASNFIKTLNESERVLKGESEASGVEHGALVVKERPGSMMVRTVGAWPSIEEIWSLVSEIYEAEQNIRNLSVRKKRMGLE